MIRTHMLDLISTTEDSHYESYRQQQMETRKFGEPKVKKLDNPKFKEEEEQLRKSFTEQVKAEESRFRKWEQHVCSFLLSIICIVDWFFSLSRNVIASIRIWKWRIPRSSNLKPNLTIFKLVMAEAREDDDLLLLLVDKFIYPKRCPFLSLLSRALLALVGLGLETSLLYLFWNTSFYVFYICDSTQ